MKMANEQNKIAWKVFMFAGIGVIAIALAVGIWGFFGKSRAVNGRHLSKNDNFLNHPQVNSAPVKTPLTNVTSKTKGKIPKALADAGELGENIYDFAKTGDWKTAELKLNDLKKAVNQLNASKNGTPKLTSALENLEKVVPAKNRDETLLQSNQFTRIAAELTAKYDSKVPVEVTKLDYYGREIEIWAGRKDNEHLKMTARDIRMTWDAVRDRVKAHNGTREAATFEKLVTETESARSITDYAKLATPILDEVDNLEKVFA